MKKQTHHIQKQQVNLDFETEEEARVWNSRFADFYYEEILPHFSSLLDNAIPDDRSYIIDRLEIDLGSIHMDEFKETFLKKAETELERILKKGDDFDSPTDKTGGAAPERSFRQEHVEPKQRDQKEHSKHEKQLRIKDRKEHLLACLIHFLDHSVLPWNSDVDTITELEFAIRQVIEPEKLASRPDFKKRMSTTSARRRFYFQFSTTFVEEVFDYIYSEELTVLSSLKEDLEKQMPRLAKDDSCRKKIDRELSKSVWHWIIETGPADPQNWSQHFIQSVMEKLLPLVKPEGETSVFKSILEELPSSSSLSIHLKEILEKQDETEADTPDQKKSSIKPPEGKHGSEDDDKKSGENAHEELSPDERIRQIDEEDKDQRKEELPDTERSGKPDSENVSSPSESDTPKGDLPEKMEPEQYTGKEPHVDLQEPGDVRDRQPDQPQDLEEYYLRNAGIILSWPYLQRLFDNLEYLADKTFKDSRVQQRAVHLLGYLASGEDQCEEHELVLAKFLCAWPLQMPIIKELELTENEMSSADEMLSSLISHWSVLKNTSVEGLRESFFSREGKLFKEDEQWRLIVEQESYDMLLDRLPYNISLIKLPWMEDILQVDWA